MDITTLKTFLEVAEVCHFGKAADNLCVTQSAVSARIRALEESLGVQLLVRERGNIHLSVEGEQLLNYAHQIVGAWDEARIKFREPSSKAQRLIIAASDNLWWAGLSEWMGVVEREQPEQLVDIQTISVSSRVLVGLLRDGALDLGFTVEPVTNVPGLQCVEVMQLELSLLSAQTESPQNVYIDVNWGRETALRAGESTPILTRNVSTVIAVNKVANTATRVVCDSARLAFERMLRVGGSAYLPKLQSRQEIEEGRLSLVHGAEPIGLGVYALYQIASDRNKQTIGGLLSLFDRVDF